ncbi:MAG: 16S rRNA (adenine(1518)-N(6)/adenine(1519)-N(6))-dimethyltransferase RsmA [Actinomycetota bacterium]
MTAGGAAASPAGGLGAGAIRELAARHAIRPSKALGQNFLIDPNLARAIAAEAGAAPGVRVVEVGAGFGSLTVALAEAGADVMAIEFDRRLQPALAEVVGGLRRVSIVAADAMKMDWDAQLGEGPWTMCANLPYNIATPLVLELLERAPGIGVFVVMVQREVGERLAAGAGEEAYGAVSVKVAYRARATLVRRVPPEVFWPRPGVESVVVRLDRLSAPPVDVDPGALWSVVEAGFAQRRKTMRNALVRLGVDRGRAGELLSRSGVDPRARAEELELAALARVATAVAAEIGPS